MLDCAFPTRLTIKYQNLISWLKYDPKYIHLIFSEIHVARFGFPDGKDGSNLEILRIAETGKFSKKIIESLLNMPCNF